MNHQSTVFIWEIPFQNLQLISNWSTFFVQELNTSFSCKIMNLTTSPLYLFWKLPFRIFNWSATEVPCFFKSWIHLFLQPSESPRNYNNKKMQVDFKHYLLSVWLIIWYFDIYKFYLFFLSFDQLRCVVFWIVFLWCFYLNLTSISAHDFKINITFLW